MRIALNLGLAALCSLFMVTMVTTVSAEVESDSQLMTEVRAPMTPTVTEAAVGIGPVQAALCDNQSHNACIGKANGAACDENGDGVNGTCIMIYPSSECVCDEPAPPPPPPVCDDQSHVSCIGKVNGAACDEDGDGRSGSCVMIYPSDECICDEPGPVQQEIE